MRLEIVCRGISLLGLKFFSGFHSTTLNGLKIIARNDLKIHLKMDKNGIQVPSIDEFWTIVEVKKEEGKIHHLFLTMPKDKKNSLQPTRFTNCEVNKRNF